MTRLPNKPSELILLALSDLEKVEKLPQYKVDMGRWHRPTNNYCLVCLAGSVIAMTLGEASDLCTYPDYYGLSDSAKLRALNRFPAGEPSPALYELLEAEIITEKDYDDLRKKMKYHLITQYEKDPDDFKADIRKLADEFQVLGF